MHPDTKKFVESIEHLPESERMEKLVSYYHSGNEGTYHAIQGLSRLRFSKETLLRIFDDCVLQAPTGNPDVYEAFSKTLSSKTFASKLKPLINDKNRLIVTQQVSIALSKSKKDSHYRSVVLDAIS